MPDMRWQSLLALVLAAGVWEAPRMRADERRFTFVYEPETLPAGALEFENWVTLRAGRNETVGQENYNRWDLRQELEYGISDRYTMALYLNETAQSYQDPPMGTEESEFAFKGVSLENRFNVLNPAAHPVGLTLYLEGRYAGDEAEVEEKLILGQRHGPWKWAINLEHATEWEDHLEEVEGEWGASLGVAYDLNPNWSVGLEFRSRTLLPAYEDVASTALFLGPVVSFHQEQWWAALSVLPQLHGWNRGGDPDGDPRLDLAENERLHVRLLIGVNF